MLFYDSLLSLLSFLFVSRRVLTFERSNETELRISTHCAIYLRFDRTLNRILYLGTEKSCSMLDRFRLSCRIIFPYVQFSTNIYPAITRQRKQRHLVGRKTQHRYFRLFLQPISPRGFSYSLKSKQITRYENIGADYQAERNAR